MTARWLLDTNPDPTEADVREAISGQVCRCTGYENIVRSVLWAAKQTAPAVPGPSEVAAAAGPLEDTE
jgi:carbon-monoxide dehydrogenase small subunit